jgi:hypothetical protein
MPIRKPNVDLSKTRARWAPIGEFARQMNASSPWILHLERFLNRVMTLANANLDPFHPSHAQIKALSPFHNPRTDPEPRAYHSYMANVEAALA